MSRVATVETAGYAKPEDGKYIAGLKNLFLLHSKNNFYGDDNNPHEYTPIIAAEFDLGPNENDEEQTHLELFFGEFNPTENMMLGMSSTWKTAKRLCDLAGIAPLKKDEAVDVFFDNENLEDKMFEQEGYFFEQGNLLDRTEFFANRDSQITAKLDTFTFMGVELLDEDIDYDIELLTSTNKAGKEVQHHSHQKRYCLNVLGFHR